MEEKLISEYIGKNADKILKENFNWAAAFSGQMIGPVWFFYRKSYLLGVAFIIITYIIASIVANLNIDKAYYIMFFIYFLTANKLYLWDVRRKVKKIISSGSHMSEEELIAIARKKGGTSTVATVIYVAIFIILTIIYGFLVYILLSAMMYS